MKRIRYLQLAIVILASLNREAAAADACPKEFIDLSTTPTISAYAPAVKSFNEFVYPNAADVVLIGDSHVGHLDADRIKQELNINNVVNISGSGDGPQNTLWRLSDKRVNLKKYKPKYVVFILGTNITTYPSCAIAEGINKVLHKSKSYWPGAKFTYVSLLPRGVVFKSDNETRLDVNNKIKVMIESMGGNFIQIDDNYITCGKINSDIDGLKNTNLACLPKESIPSCQFYKDDHVHLTSAGYAYISGKIIDTLKKEERL